LLIKRNEPKLSCEELNLFSVGPRHADNIHAPVGLAGELDFQAVVMTEFALSA
jgi:hypothetical protein